MDFPSLLRSSVNLTFGRKRCSESVVVWLLLAFSFPACFLTVDFPSLLRSSVNLTFGRKRCSESVVALLLHLLLPCFYCPAHQVPWEDRKPYNKKRHTLRCAFTSISGFLSSQAVSSQVLSAFMNLTTVFEMGTGGSS